MTSGRKYFLESGITRKLVFGRRCRRYDAIDHIVTGHPVTFGGKIDHHAVPEDGFGQLLDVVDRDMKTTFQQCPGLAAEDQKLDGPRTGAPADDLRVVEREEGWILGA